MKRRRDNVNAVVRLLCGAIPTKKSGFELTMELTRANVYVPCAVEGPPRARQHLGTAAEIAEHAFSITGRCFVAALERPKPCSEKATSRKTKRLPMSSSRSGRVENLPVSCRRHRRSVVVVIFFVDFVC